MKLKVKKVGMINPTTRVRGFAARVVTNGTAGYDDIVTQATRNTTIHRAEAKVALELCMETVAELLKQGYIVELGPVGKLYPSCSSGWFAKTEDLQLADVKPSLYFHPADDIAAAIKGATLQWVKDADTTGDDTGNDDDTTNDTPADGDDPDTGGGGGGNVLG